jgi:hypothetical protein
LPEETELPDEQEVRDFDESRRRFEVDAAGRLSNVLPLDAARNEGRFYGQLIRGRPLTGVQRVGFFLIGSMFCFFAVFVFLSAIPPLRHLTGLARPWPGETYAPFYVPFAVLWFLLGFAAVVKAFTPKKHQ